MSSLYCYCHKCEGVWFYL
ncbi:MAG: zf-TFIIB domain-containing protein [Bacteroidaceae bacterium]|nr:zf-TFIIB domain-containing protein [Bacteroidaceae bacterium]